MPAAVAVVGERRSKQRFPIATPVEYLLQPDALRPERGRGFTVNLSVNSLLFRAERPLPTGKNIRLSIEWPVRLEPKVGLSLIIKGRTARTDGKQAVVLFSRYDFRTRPLK